MGEELQDLSGDFQMVEKAYVPGSSRRNPAGGVARRSGILKLNARSSGDMVELAQSEGLDPAMLYLLYQVSVATRTIAVHVVSPNTPSATPARRDADNRTYTLYLHSVYDQYPSLRPDGKTRVSVTRGQVKGRPALLIHLSGLAARSVKRESPEESGS